MYGVENYLGFINPEFVKGVAPFLILRLTFVTTMTLWYFILVYSSSLITQTLRDNIRIGKIMHKISGFVFIGLGLKILTEK